MYHVYYPAHEFGYMGGGGEVFGIIILFGIAVLGLLVVKHFMDGGNHMKSRANSVTPTNTALTILQERYAKGDISTEDYQERKRVLRDSADTVASTTPAKP